MKFADAHIHIRNLKDTEITSMLDLMSSLGVTDTCILALPYRSCAENLAALYYKDSYKKMTVRAFGGWHVTDRYATLPKEEIVKNLMKLSFDGVKIMDTHPEFRAYLGYGICDRPYFKAFEYIEENGIPVNMHALDPHSWWQNGGPYDKPYIPRPDAIYKEIFALLDRHPRLKICFAHFFFLSGDAEEAARVLDKYPNVYFDLTPGTLFFDFAKNPALWHDFFEKYSGRILFGTDSNGIKKCNRELNRLVYRALTEKGPYSEFCYGRSYDVEGLYLSKESIDKILYTNYRDFVGKRREVDREFYNYSVKKVYQDLTSFGIDELYERGKQLIPELKKDPEQNVALSFLKTQI